jgi:hypothetical protein
MEIKAANGGALSGRTRHNSGAGSPREAGTRTACLRAKAVGKKKTAAAGCGQELRRANPSAISAEQGTGPGLNSQMRSQKSSVPRTKNQNRGVSTDPNRKHLEKNQTQISYQHRTRCKLEMFHRDLNKVYIRSTEVSALPPSFN